MGFNNKESLTLFSSVIRSNARYLEGVKWRDKGEQVFFLAVFGDEVLTYQQKKGQFQANESEQIVAIISELCEKKFEWGQF